MNWDLAKWYSAPFTLILLNYKFVLQKYMNDFLAVQFRVHLFINRFFCKIGVGNWWWWSWEWNGGPLLIVKNFYGGDLFGQGRPWQIKKCPKHTYLPFPWFGHILYELVNIQHTAADGPILDTITMYWIICIIHTMYYTIVAFIGMHMIVYF